MGIASDRATKSRMTVGRRPDEDQLPPCALQRATSRGKIS
jgi:hypothetical protein